MKSLKYLPLLTFVFAAACQPNKTASDSVLDLDEMRASRLAQKSHAKKADACRFISEISQPPPEKTVVLTIDDGPNTKANRFLLDLLNKYQIKATFFVVGSRLPDHQQQVKELLEEGHMLANHSFSHANFHKISHVKQRAEIEKTDELISEFVDYKIARYPYGNSTCYANDEFHRLGYKILGWHVDSCDWAYNATGSVSEKDADICGVSRKNRKNYVGHVLDSVRKKNGGIILIHENQPNTLQQLETILKTLLEEGYSFVNLDDPSMDKYFY
jgi:peptidoglycan/xylan/chitin deacetylase (PgdA/CDA1 family)